MDIQNIQYLIGAKFVPGRSSLKTLLCQLYTASKTDPGGGATTMQVAIGSPSIGFIRIWDYMHVVWAAPAAGDKLVLLFSQQALSLLIAEIDFAAGFQASAGVYPLIGNVQNANRTSPGCWRGGPPLLIGHEDTILLSATFTAGSGQTATVTGRYCDYPM